MHSKVFVTVLALASSIIVSATNFSYAPKHVQCPEHINWIRPADKLAPAEAKWIKGKKKVVLKALQGYLERLKLEDFDDQQYTESLKDFNFRHVPVIGLAISGGGWSSAITGTGLLNALDSRIPGANEQKIGGLTQALTYLSGQSGGSWPVVSFTTSGFPTAYEILELWQPTINRFDANKTTDHTGTDVSMFQDLAKKLEAGFNISVADFFGRAFAYEFVRGDQGGLNVTLSSVASQHAFQHHEMPFPLVQVSEVTDSSTKYYGLKVPHANSTLYEMTPFEFGAWTGPYTGFTPMEFAGTQFFNGTPVNDSKCVRNFDNAGFIMGAAAAAFNFWYIEDESNNTLTPFPKRSMVDADGADCALSKRVDDTPLAELESIADGFKEYFGLNLTQIPYAYWPNPFYGYTSSSAGSNPYKKLELADATEIGQAIPLWSQIQPQRKVDFIFAWDSNGDAYPYNWNNGTNLYNTYLEAEKEGLAFPIVPPPSTFILRNYTSRPVFFGCDAKLTTTKSTDSPIVLYLANTPYSAYTNYSYTQNVMEFEQVYEIYTNSFNFLTQGNGTLAGTEDFTACLGCAVIERSLKRVGMKRTQQCDVCLTKYCWDGEEAEGEAGVVDLPLALDPTLSFAEWNKTHPF